MLHAGVYFTILTTDYILSIIICTFNLPNNKKAKKSQRLTLCRDYSMKRILQKLEGGLI